MSQRRIGATVAAITAVAIGATAMAAEKGAIKQLMGENFAGLQTILVSLITSNYSAVPKQADIIREHAVELEGMVPESAADERQQFLTYAYTLRSHAKSLKSIAEVLMQHDAARKPGEGVATDHLREALAAHYGGMVTTCVACHNHYRPQVITP